MAASIVLFDLGDVIAAWNSAARLAEYARRTGLSPTEVRDRLSTDGFWVETDRGAYSSAEMEGRICELLGFDFSREELLRLQAMAFEVRPQVVSIARVVATQARIGILTNNAPLLKEAFPDHFSELAHLFHPVLFSFQFGHVKPERELFAAVQAHLDVPAGEILFIDDNPGHVSAAKSVGWGAIQYRSVEELRQSLIEYGIDAGAA